MPPHSLTLCYVLPACTVQPTMRRTHVQTQKHIHQHPVPHRGGKARSQTPPAPATEVQQYIMQRGVGVGMDSRTGWGRSAIQMSCMSRSLSHNFNAVTSKKQDLNATTNRRQRNFVYFVVRTTQSRFAFGDLSIGLCAASSQRAGAGCSALESIGGCCIAFISHIHATSRRVCVLPSCLHFAAVC